MAIIEALVLIATVKQGVQRFRFDGFGGNDQIFTHKQIIFEMYIGHCHEDEKQRIRMLGYNAFDPFGGVRFVYEALLINKHHIGLDA